MNRIRHPFSTKSTLGIYPLFMPTLFCTVIFSSLLISHSVLAEAFKESMQVQLNNDKAAIKSQKTIDGLAEQSNDLIDEYKYVLRQTESLRQYNNHMQSLVKDQNQELASLDTQLNDIDNTNQGIVPLMLRMINGLDQIVQLDAPFLLKERNERVANLKKLMARADVATSEKYRRVLEAYQVETEYGRTIEAYREILPGSQPEREVDFLRLGRVALYYLSLDGDEVGAWDSEKKQWAVLDDSYRRLIRKALRVAKKQLAPELLRLPVPAAKEAPPQVTKHINTEEPVNKTAALSSTVTQQQVAP